MFGFENSHDSGTTTSVPCASRQFSGVFHSSIQEQPLVGVPVAATNASIETVFPNPISSARIPPRKGFGGSPCVVPLRVF